MTNKLIAIVILVCFFGSVQAQDYTFQNSDIISSIQFEDGLLGTTQNSQRPVSLGNHSGKLGLSYNFQPQTSIDIFGSFARRRWEMSAITTTAYSGNVSPIQRDLLMGNETNTTTQHNISIHAQHKFKQGHTLIADYDYLNFSIENPTRYRLKDFSENGQQLSTQTFETTKETPFNFHIAQLAYQSILNDKLNVDAGVKAILSQVKNNTALLDENGSPSSNPLFTDEMDLAEQIYAAYVSIEGSVNSRYSFSAGVRYEYSNLELVAAQGNVNRQISRLFPTLSITRSFSEFHKLTLAFRERISRPSFQNLAPAFFFLNPYTLLTGNIQALPNLNRTVEATFNHQSFFAAFSYSHDNAPIVRFAIPQLNQEDNLLLLISDNIENRQQVGLNMGFPVAFTKFWNSRYAIGSYWRRDKVRFDESTFIESNPIISVDVSQSFQFFQDWSLELSGRLNSRTYQGTIYQPQQLFVNFGIQKKFKNGTLGLSWSDIFNSGSFLGFVNELPSQGVVYDWNYDIEGSIVKLSYSYNFGKQQMKKLRSSRASDVLQRFNN